jgi:hypothetical protein
VDNSFDKNDWQAYADVMIFIVLTLLGFGLFYLVDFLDWKGKI